MGGERRRRREGEEAKEECSKDEAGVMMKSTSIKVSYSYCGFRFLPVH